ncbi:MAG: TonB-dependent receptor [Leadbetterella sp.]
MKHTICMLLIVVLQTNIAFCQNILKAVIKDSKTNEILLGASAKVLDTSVTSTSDSTGILVLKNIPNGQYTLSFSYVSFETQSKTFTFPLENNDLITILLHSETTIMDEVSITSTRSSRTIKNIPTRIEFVAGEELDEKSNMKSGDIRLLLSESTGIQIQQTSATSANASIRIQGLDGRYTQILKDGFPLFQGAASGLGLLQTPPLDLKQVEIVKGSASTLYGGGAIAGLVNLISKNPSQKRDLRFHVNGNSGKGFDINGFYGKKYQKIGTTIFASYNRNWAYDPSDVGLTAIPKFERYVFNPKLFIDFNSKTKLNVGLNSAIENRIGGNIKFIEGKEANPNSFYEENETQRYSTQLTFDHKINSNSSIRLKNSYSYFDREITIPQYKFSGIQQATFTEASYTNNRSKTSEWIVGGNIWTDSFEEKRINTSNLRSYEQITLGAFIQNYWKTTPWLSLESGIRTDYVGDYGTSFLPRISALFTINSKLSSRIGAGYGYKAPTIFTEESERIQYKNILPIDKTLNILEKSYGGNMDINYSTYLGEKVNFSINQLFFYTFLNNPLLLQSQPNNTYKFINSAGHIDTRGIETNVKVGYGDFKLFLGYTLTDTRLHENDMFTETTLTPKHRMNSILLYEVEDRWKLGLEAYYFSKQKLSDGATGKQYVICGFMAEKKWEKFSIYINFENFLDARQTRFDTIYKGTLNNPTFRDIYAPMDGFILNGGLKIKL